MRPAISCSLRIAAALRAATGYYAGRKAAEYAKKAPLRDICRDDVKREKQRLYAPLLREEGMDWRELNMAISKAMQNYCGEVKCRDLLLEGLSLLESYREEAVPQICCRNPHELMRAHEVFDILDVSEMILHACLLRESSSEPLCFVRSDFPQTDPQEDRRFITLRQEGGEVVAGSVPLDYFGDLEEEYEKRNRDYIEEARVKYYGGDGKENE